MNTEPCPSECKYTRAHAHGCKNADENELRRHVAQLMETADHYYSLLARAYLRAERWEGKFAIVKHENNAMRKRLRAALDKIEELEMRWQKARWEKVL